MNNITNFSYGEGKRKQLLASFGVLDTLEKAFDDIMNYDDIDKTFDAIMG